MLCNQRKQRRIVNKKSGFWTVASHNWVFWNYCRLGLNWKVPFYSLCFTGFLQVKTRLGCLEKPYKFVNVGIQKFCSLSWMSQAGRNKETLCLSHASFFFKLKLLVIQLVLENGWNPEQLLFIFEPQTLATNQQPHVFNLIHQMAHQNSNLYFVVKFICSGIAIGYPKTSETCRSQASSKSDKMDTWHILIPWIPGKRKNND